MTFSHNYSPDFYLIDDLYHHEESTTDIKDTIWSFDEHIAG